MSVHHRSTSVHNQHSQSTIISFCEQRKYFEVEAEKMSKRVTFFHQIRLFLIFFMIFGIWPSWQNDTYRYPLIAYSIYSISIVFGIFTSAFFVYDVIEENSLSNVVAYSFLLSILATHLIIQIEALFKRNSQMKLITKLDYIDHLFSSCLHVSMPYKRETCALILRMGIFIGILLGIKTVFIVYLQYSDSSNFWLHNFYSIWIMRLRCMQVLFFVYLLRARITALSDKMLEILQMNGWQHGAKRNGKGQMKNVIFVLNSIDPVDSVYEQLYYVKQIYGELFELGSIVSCAFGWSLLAILTQIFIDFVSNSYWTFRALEDVFMDFTKCVDCILLIVSIIFTLGTLAFYCASCTQRVSAMFLLFGFAFYRADTQQISNFFKLFLSIF